MGSRQELQLYHANVSMATKRLFSTVIATIKSVTVATEPVQSVESCFNEALRRFVEELKYAYAEFTKAPHNQLLTLGFEEIRLAEDSILSSVVSIKSELNGGGGGNGSAGNAQDSDDEQNENMESKEEMSLQPFAETDDEETDKEDIDYEDEYYESGSDNDPSFKQETSEEAYSEQSLDDVKTDLGNIRSGKVCKKCGKVFDSSKKLRRHVQRSCRRKVETEAERMSSTYCQLCHKFFSTKGNLTKHMKNQHQMELSPKRKTARDPAKTSEPPPLKCKICEHPYYTQSGLFKHMRKKHIKILAHTLCDICDAEFPSTQLLDKHLLEKHGIDNSETFICKVCSDVFYNEDEFTTHAKTHIEDEEDLRKCEPCGIFFEQPYLLRKHNVSVHGMPTQYKCEECDRYFFAQSKLDTHMAAKHGGTKVYTCEFCGKAFSCNDGLKQHRVLHGIKTDFHCDTCDRYFAHKSMLRRHIENKHGEKQSFQCSQCGVIFSHLKTLNEHSKKHLENNVQQAQ